MPKEQGIKIIADNRKVFHDYFIEEKYECGIVLAGTEVKSLRAGKCNLRDSYVTIKGGEMYLLGVNISPYDHGSIYNVDPMRPRKLLLNRREIRRIDQELTREGLTLIPLSLYINEKGKAKLSLGIARGKKLYDKRQSIAKREAGRRMDRAVKASRN